MSTEPQHQVEKTADRLRTEFLVTLRELDRRAHRAMDVWGLLHEKRRVLLAAGAGVAAAIVLVAGTRAALSRARRGRRSERRKQGLRRAWEKPDRLATRAEDVPRSAMLLLGLLEVVAVAAGSQLLRRGAQRALPAGQ